MTSDRWESFDHVDLDAHFSKIECSTHSCNPSTYYEDCLVWL